MITISEILEQAKTYIPEDDIKVVMHAYLVAARSHQGQFRKSGDPYLTHPLSVAKILADMQMDAETIATALLHDSLEDNPLTPEELKNEVGPVITSLVEGVTKIGKLKFKSKEELAAENFRKMMLAMSKDLRVILVKLADRLHNMSTLEYHDPEKQISISQETREIYVPIAGRLGLVKFKNELEEFVFRYLEPDAYAEIIDFLGQTQEDRERFIEVVCDALRELLIKNEMEGDVKGRAKHAFGIYTKMITQGLSVDKVLDILAFRVIFAEIGDCYAFLGIIHSLFPPIPGRIKDYIARPKPNGYQSLHTTVVGPNNRPIELQLRTENMHRMAEDGIAAHWHYKEGDQPLSPDDIAKITKIRDLFENAQEADNATEFMETLKVDLYSNEVFVFTPAGDIKKFPVGATPIDFAFSVHTEVGHHCTGAKVDGRMVSLRYQLKSGESIEIITAPNQKPSRDWLDMAKSGRALQKIRNYLRKEEQTLGIRIGKELLEGELHRYHWTLQKIRDKGRISETLTKRGYKDLDTMLIDIARGHLGLGTITKELLPDLAGDEAEEGLSGISSIFQRWRGRTESPVLISGEDGVLVGFAKCCNPLPGEAVTGFITRGRGITVHRRTCDQLSSLDQERKIAVQWDPNCGTPHSGEIEIYCQDRPGMLAHITSTCEHANVNITRAEARHIDTTRAICTLQVTVRDINELSRLIIRIEKIDGVEQAHRKTH